MNNKEGTPPVQNYRHLAVDYDGSRYRGDVNVRKEAHRRAVLDALIPENVQRALDVACGTGRGLITLRKRAVSAFGLDGTIEMLALAREKDSGLSVCQGNAAQLPFGNESFDLVTCLNFVHLFASLESKLPFTREIARILRPGGHAVVEFDNALHGLILGPFRKFFGRDIGYDWPWTMKACFPVELFEIEAVMGANVPFIWRLPGASKAESTARVFPVNYLANRVFLKARRV